MRNKKSFVITLIILVAVVVFAKYQNSNQVTTHAYQNNQVDQGVKAFKVNGASKI
jgi:uncharacterized membrane protein